MKTLPTRRSVLAGAAAGSVMLGGCSVLRTGINPLLATKDIGQRLFVAQHLDGFALSLFPTLLFAALPLLLSNRAFGVLALALVTNALKLGVLGASPEPVRVYMTLDNNTMVMLNPETGAVLATIPLGQQPALIAASATGDLLAVTNAVSNSVSIVTTSDNRVSKTIQLEAGSAPYGVAMTADGTTVYVANEARNSVSVLDVPAGRVVSSIPTPGNPSKITLSPDGSLLWAPAAGGTIYVIDTLSNTVSNTVAGIANPVAVAFNPTGTKAYVTSAPAGTAGSVVVVDTSNYSVLSRMPVGMNPYSIALSAGGTRAYVSNFDSNTVSILDTVNDQVLSTLATGKAPIEVAVV